QDDLGSSGATRSRLAYDELLASQLVLALRRRQTRGAERAMHDEGGRRRLPFELTSSQSKALEDIVGDMDGGDGGGRGGLRMFRLLQGDVGSGKTAVAFLAMLNSAGQGSQSCVLTPTEVLTSQHLQVRSS
ncbi:unnamed protein product, partial [Hapterophycus canaliculatus]